MKILVAFSVLLVAVSGLPINHCDEEFKEFKAKYDKLYITSEEENTRKSIFCKNLLNIAQHNEQFEQGKTTFKMGVNKFSDMTDGEMEQFRGFSPNKKFLALNDCRKEWKNFKKIFNKLYDLKEESLRYKIFCQNFQSIEKHNKDYEQGLVHFRMGINQFSDLTEEEMKQFMGMLPQKTSVENKTCENEWTNFKNKFNKLYDSEEETLRYQIFCQNLEIIKKHNENFEQGLVTSRMGVNKFSDLTEEEMKQFMGILPKDISIGNDKCKNEWTNFKNKFNELYDSEEESLRYQVFCQNFRIIENHNKDFEKGLVTFKMGVNRFSDLTKQEMKQFMGVLIKMIPIGNDKCKNAWTSFKNKFNKLYDSEEESLRYKIFCHNFEIIKKHNKDFEQGLVDFKMGVNQFSDLTEEEMEQFIGFLPYKISTKDDACQEKWATFKDVYNKLYETEEEERNRHEIFCNNLDIIEKHNQLYQQGMVTDEFGINQFTDLTAEEMSKYFGFDKNIIV